MKYVELAKGNAALSYVHTHTRHALSTECSSTGWLWLETPVSGLNRATVESKVHALVSFPCQRCEK